MITQEIISSIKDDPRKERTRLSGQEKVNLAAYYGGVSLLPEVFPMSQQEDKMKYLQRQQQTIYHYENFPKYVLKTLGNSLFRDDGIHRDVVDENDKEMEDYFLDDYFDNEYANFIQRKAFDFSLQLDECYGYVAEPDEYINSVNGKITVADREANNLFPKPYLVFGSKIVAVKFNKDEKMIWAAIERVDDKGKEYIEIIDKEEIATIWSDGFEVRTPAYKHKFLDENNKPTMPLVRMAFSENYSCKGLLGHAYMSDITAKSIGCLQFISMFVEACYAHLSLKIVMNEESAKETKKYGIGNYGIMIEVPSTLPGGKMETVPIRYLQMPNVELDKLIDIVFNRIPESIRIAAQLRAINANASGVAKIIDSTPELSAVKTLANYLEPIDNTLANLIARKTNPATRVKTKYPKTFEVRNITEQVTDWVSFASLLTNKALPQTETGIREVTKGIYQGFLPGLDPDKRGMINEQIDIAPIDFLSSMVDNLTSNPIQDVLKNQDSIQNGNDMQTQKQTIIDMGAKKPNVAPKSKAISAATKPVKGPKYKTAKA